MKNIKRVLTLLLMGVVLGAPLAVWDVFHGNPVRSRLMENATQEHLLGLGYEPGDLLEVAAFYSIKKDAGVKRTRAHVVFKDEPDERYVYVQREGGEIQQGCSHFDADTGAYGSEYTEKRKHMVKDCLTTLFSLG